jgi:AcrR family transcriptional regulator
MDVATVRRNRVREKKDRERARIIRVARGLFFRNGYAGTTVDSIASALNVKKPFIYWYFDNKEALFAELCIRNAEAAISTLVDPADEPDPLKALYESCRRIALVQILDYETSAITFREPNALAATSRQRMNKYSHTYSVGLAKILNRAKRIDAVRCKNVRLTALAMGGIVTSLHRWYDPNGRLGPQDLAHEIACLMVGTANGRDCQNLKPKRALKRFLDLDDEPWGAKYWWLTIDQV